MLMALTSSAWRYETIEKRRELWTAVSGLLALISRAYPNFSLWHHEFIKAARSAALVVLN